MLPILFCGLIFHINSPFSTNNVSSLVSALITRAIGVLTQLLIECTCPVMSSLMKRYFQPSTDHFFLLPQGFQPLRPLQLSSSYPTPSSKFRSLLLQPLPTLLLAQLLLMLSPLHLVVLILEFLTHYLLLQFLPCRWLQHIHQHHRPPPWRLLHLSRPHMTPPCLFLIRWSPAPRQAPSGPRAILISSSSTQPRILCEPYIALSCLNPPASLKPPSPQLGVLP